MITNTKNIQETLEEMKLIYNWSTSTHTLYKTALNNYITFQETTFQDLINEAETEENTINKISKRSIQKRLIKYRLYLQQKLTPNTVISYTSAVMKVYKYLDVETPELPPVRKIKTETFDDIPTKDEIKKAILNSSRTKMKAIISFIASSGLRRSDVAAITIKDFLNATSEYYKNSADLLDILNQLEHQDMIIPTWKIRSIKTSINHITFSSDESTKFIIQMLKERFMKKDINLDDRLFDVNAETITHNFHTINTKLDMGWKTTRRHFHPHSLRKYFATTLTSNDVPYLDTQFLLGHSLSDVDSSYYFINSEKLKSKYIFIIKYLTFTQELDYIAMSDADKRELEELKQFKLESMKKINQLEEMVNFLSNK